MAALLKWAPAYKPVACFLVASVAVVSLLFRPVIDVYASNADFLFLPGLFGDLYDRGTVGSWRLPPAGYYVPDMIIYGAANALFLDFRSSIILAALLQVLLFFVGGAVLYRQMGGRRSTEFLLTLLAALGVVFGLASGFNVESVQLWLGGLVTTAVHFGAVIAAVWALCLLVASLKPGPGGVAPLVGLGALALACSLSDSLFVVWFNVPAAGALLLLYPRWAPSARRRLWHGIAVLAGVSALAAILQIQFNEVANVYRGNLSLDRVATATRLELGLFWQLFGPMFMKGYYFSPFCYAAILCPLAVCLLVMARHWFVGRDRPLDAAVAWRMLPVYVGGLAGLSALLSPALLALYGDYMAMRYMTLAFYLPVVALIGAQAQTIGRCLDRRWARTLPAWTTAFGALVIGYFAVMGGFHRPLTSPAALSCLPRGPAAGLADYWHARPLTLHSTNRLQVEPLLPAGAPYWWIGNRFWFLHAFRQADRLPPYSFIVMTGLDAAAVEQQYGAPTRRTSCAGTEIWYYDEPGRLAEAFAASYYRIFPAQPDDPVAVAAE